MAVLYVRMGIIPLPLAKKNKKILKKLLLIASTKPEPAPAPTLDEETSNEIRALDEKIENMKEIKMLLVLSGHNIEETSSMIRAREVNPRKREEKIRILLEFCGREEENKNPILCIECAPAKK